MLLKNKKFLTKYTSEVQNLLSDTTTDYSSEILNLYKFIKETDKKKGKVIIFGNGGSAATSSHFSVDLMKNAKIKSLNFNEADFITCLANDFGHDNWVKKAFEFNTNKSDFSILLSTSGNSKNVINAANYLKRKKFNFFILTGMKFDNNLKKINPTNSIWVNSMAYNQIEIVHHFILLAIIDMIIGKSVYKA
ncbi:SIS domain-containing protein [Candidatus Pelagibacter sp. Uisw_094]|uniref:SIS domain-containing protein n=1 Tax=Candidatus Pelagibacter sp. Uisw_094 TaxID=3230980 RepID=UPI0039EA671A|tara:strand:+ start:210 stop:785 length:576 start_codon:yes stop_codon:yes gene_type:complete